MINIEDLVADITPAPGQGESTSFLFEAHTLAQNATAQGTGALIRRQFLTLREMISFHLKLSDGNDSL